jgi:serine/threonine protein kinase
MKIHSKQDGGDVLGEGGYGCIVTPPLKCKNPFFNVPYSIDKKYISKIVEYDDNDPEILNETKLGHKLNKIDPFQKHFTPIINGCPFINQPHKDIDYISFKPFSSDDYDDDDEYNSYDSSSYKKKEKCNVYGNEEYLNLISKNAGINIKDTLNSREPSVLTFFRKNYVVIFKHLLKGLQILHKHNIIHRDIKSVNVMIKYKKENNKASVTYIDFGLAEELNISHNYTLNELYYLTGAGTFDYKSLEITIIHYILEHMKKNRFKQTSSLKNEVLHKLLSEYREISEEYAEKYYFNEEGFNFKNNKLDKHIKIDNNFKYGNKKYIYNIFAYVISELNENRLHVDLTNKNNYLYKWDVFSLGLVFAEIIIKANINDNLAYQLVNNMINPFYWKRYSVEDCLNDELFTEKTRKKSSKSSKSLFKTNLNSISKTLTKITKKLKKKLHQSRKVNKSKKLRK